EDLEITPGAGGALYIADSQWPSGFGSFGQVLTTDGDGVLSWEDDTIGTGDVVGPDGVTDSDFAQFDGTTGKLIKGGLALTTSTTLAGNSNTNVPSEAAVKTYVDTILIGYGGSDT